VAAVVLVVAGVSVVAWQLLKPNNHITANATWTLKLNGKISETIDANTLIQLTKASANGGASWTDSDGYIYFGIPLWILVGRVDDTQPSGFNSTLADLGYLVRVKGSDGFYRDLTSASVKMNNDIIVVYEMDGKALPSNAYPLELVGAVPNKGWMVRLIAEIDIIFPS
jgi:hypothetical protein